MPCERALKLRHEGFVGRELELFPGATLRRGPGGGGAEGDVRREMRKKEEAWRDVRAEES